MIAHAIGYRYAICRVAHFVPIEQFVGSEFRWRQTRLFKREFNLLSDGLPVARLHWHGRFSKTATVETASDRWTIRGIVFTQDFKALGSDPRNPLATFKAAWRGEGTLHLAGTAAWYVVKRKSRYHIWGRWALIDDTEREIARFAESTSFSLIYEVLVETNGGAQSNKLPLLPIIMSLYAITSDARKRNLYLFG